MKQSFPVNDKEVLSKCLDFIENALREMGTETRTRLNTLLLAEESLVQLLHFSDSDSTLRISIQKHFGTAQILIRANGQEYDPYLYADTCDSPQDSLIDEDIQRVTRSLILKAQGDKLKFSHKNGVNSVRILAEKKERSMLLLTLAALVFGVLFGLILKYALPANISEMIGTTILTPIRTVFMNALKIIIAPVVFFSIVSCVSQFKDLSELGRVGAKVIAMYFFTSILAVLMALGLASLINPGTPGFALSMRGSVPAPPVDTTADFSLLSTIVNIVPSNFLEPFLSSDTLQIIFLALLCGTAVGAIGEYSAPLQNLMEGLNSLFLTITTMISRFIPLVVFCSVSLMVTDMDGNSLLSMLSMAGTNVLIILLMLVVYGILILLVARLNPFTFFKKNREGMLTSFTLCSSSAAMPTNMRTCTEKLGISPKVSSFSIPLGATINMDGMCINLVVYSLFLANAYGVNVPAKAMLSLVLTIVLLSVGAPGVPGSGLVCLGVTLGAIGVPVEAIGLIIAIDPFIDMFRTMSNTCGDVAASLIVAKSEGLLDIEKYNNLTKGH